MSQTRIAGRKWILLLLAVTMVATPAAAQAPERPVLADGTATGNAEAGSMGAGTDRIAGETINLHVSNADGTASTFSFEVTEDGRIENLDRGARDDATMTMLTDESTFEAIAQAPNPERKFGTAVERGDVEVRGVGTSDDAETDVFDSLSAVVRSLDLD